MIEFGSHWHWQVEGFLFLCTSLFVTFTAATLCRQWFMRLDNFDVGVPGPSLPTSALKVELRQRQIIAVLLRRGPANIQVELGVPVYCPHRSLRYGDFVIFVGLAP